MKETKIVQSYPSDSAIQDAIEEWQAFGWELVSNQKFSDSQDLWSPVGTTVRTTTYNKLTFSREKNSRWYGEITAIEQEYLKLENDIYDLRSCKPEKKTGCLDIALACLPPIYLIFWIVKKVKYKKALNYYETSIMSEIRKLEAQGKSLRNKAAAVIEKYETAQSAQYSPSAGKRFCPSCGAENSSEGKFCARCGNEL